MSAPLRAAGSRLSPIGSIRALPSEFPRVVLVLASGDLVASFGFSLFFPFLTIYLVEKLGASAAEAGLVVAAYSLFSIGSGVAGGWLADRFGRRPVLVGSISCTTILVFTMAFASEAWHFGLIMLLLGTSDPAFLPAARAAVSDTVDEDRRPRAFALLGVANAVGWIAGPVIGAGLSSIGYPLLFGVSGLLVGSYAVIAWRWLPETRPRSARHGREPEPAVGCQAGVARFGSTLSLDRLRFRIFLAFLPLLAVAQGLTFLWVTTLPIYAAGGLRLPTPLWGLLFGLNGLLIVLFQLRIAGVSERWSKPRLMAAALACYAVGMTVVAVLDTATAVAGLALVIGLVTLGEMLLVPVMAAFVSDLSPARQRGTYQGIALAAGSVGSGLGPPIAGHILDTAPGPVLWLGVAAMLAWVALGMVALGRWTDRLPTNRGAPADDLGAS